MKGYVIIGFETRFCGHCKLTKQPRESLLPPKALGPADLGAFGENRLSLSCLVSLQCPQNGSQTLKQGTLSHVLRHTQVRVLYLALGSYGNCVCIKPRIHMPESCLNQHSSLNTCFEKPM